MMQNEFLITHLIVQDMKHHQLIEGLKKLGFENPAYHLDIGSAVARLQGLDPEALPDSWWEWYYALLDRALDYPITAMGEGLGEVARVSLFEACNSPEKL